MTLVLCAMVALSIAGSVAADDGSRLAETLAEDGFTAEAAAADGALEAYRRLGQIAVDEDGMMVPGDMQGVPARMQRDIERRLSEENAVRQAQGKAAEGSLVREEPIVEEAIEPVADDEVDGEADADLGADDDELPEYDDLDDSSWMDDGDGDAW